jgi:hypothetical protein
MHQTGPSTNSKNDRRISEKPLAMVFDDTGYIYICPHCRDAKSRYGGPVFGERDILVKRCATHRREQYAKDLDTFIKGHERVDPMPTKYVRVAPRKKPLG